MNFVSVSLIPGIPGFIRNKLLGQLFAGLFLILLLSGLIAGYFYVGVEDQLGQQVETQVRETANLQSDIYTAWFDSRDADMGEVASNLRAQSSGDGDPESINANLQSETLAVSLISHSDFTAFHLVDPDTGDVLASSAESARGQSFDADRFRASEFVTEQFVSVTGETVMAIGDPLGTRIGVILVGEVNTTTGGPEIRQTVEGSETFVVSEAGNPVLGGESIDPTVMMDARETPIQQNGVLVSGVQLDNGLVVVTRSPVEEAFVLQERILRSFIITLLVTFGVLSLVIGLGGRSVQKSLTRLARRAREMEAGDLSVEFSTGRVDEIGDLYGSFDAMRTALREQLRESQEATAQAERFNEQLQVIGRVLRHNLRNDLNVIKIYAKRIENADSQSIQLDARRVHKQSENLLAKAEKQRTLVEVLSSEASPEPRDISSWLENAVNRVAREYPQAQVTLDTSGLPKVMATLKIESAVEELLVNAIIHSDQETPAITLDGRMDGDEVRLRVSDNGPRIPEIESSVLSEQDIDPLNHGSGIGLWLVYWIVSQSDGELLFETNEPRGNTVIIKLQRASDSS